MAEDKKPVSVDSQDTPLPAEVLEADEKGILAEVSPLHQLDPTKTARYKIQVQFGKERTTNGPNVLGITLWESGRKLDGEGDTLMYWCSEMDEVNPKTGKMLHKGTAGCGGIISDAFINAATISSRSGERGARQLLARCPHCEGVVAAERLTSIMTYRVTTDRLAEILAGLWGNNLAVGGLCGSADIYLKYHWTDMHYIAMEAQLGHDKAREMKGAVIYPLANLLKDTMSGSAVEDRLRAFLKS